MGASPIYWLPRESLHHGSSFLLFLSGDSFSLHYIFTRTCSLQSCADAQLDTLARGYIPITGVMLLSGKVLNFIFVFCSPLKKI